MSDAYPNFYYLRADQGEMVYGMTRPVKQVADLRRKKNESEWAWNRRVDGQARVAINEANLEEKFDVSYSFIMPKKPAK